MAARDDRLESPGNAPRLAALTRGSGCPDPETLAACLDGMLPTGEREQVAAHVVTCETCGYIFTEAAQIRVAATVAVPRVVRASLLERASRLRRVQYWPMRWIM